MIGFQSLELEMSLEMIPAHFKNEETGPQRGSDLLTVTRPVSADYWLLSSVPVTEQKWGSAACHHLQPNSRGRGWWGRKEVFMKRLHN